MLEFKIALHSFPQVQEPVSISSLHTFPPYVGYDIQKIDGTPLMDTFSSDFSKLLQVYAGCSMECHLYFQKNIARFLV